MSSGIADRYQRDGLLSPVRIIDGSEATRHRSLLESAEEKLGPLHYVNKIHTVMSSPLELATHPTVLDTVEALIGHDILLYSTTYIIKEPHTETYVAWHQDLTYWGLADDDAQVSMWLALAPATVESGCMMMIPGSHKGGRGEHVEDPGDGNVLQLGQRLARVDDAEVATPCALSPGEASFHHGWTIHTSAPNTTDDRRIGLNVQYVAPHNKQAGRSMSATLVRGEDRYGFYQSETLPQSALDHDRANELRERDAAMKASFETK